MHSATIEQIQTFIDRCAFNRWMGMRVLAADADGIEVSVTWREEFVSNPDRRSTHGGILASIVDAAGDYAVAAIVGKPVPTVDMRVDYHRVATPGDLRARAMVVHLGGTLSVAETRISDQQGRLVASGRAVYFTGALPGLTNPVLG